VKWWKKLFIHLFDLALVNAHILPWKICTKVRLCKFIKKVAEGLIAEVGRELTEQSHFAYRIPVMGMKKKENASIHGSTPTSTTKSTMEVSVSGTAVRFITLK
jgi:hypothetical protein